LAQILFGAGVSQSLPNDTELNRVELLFTDIGWPGLPPLARHAYVLVTTPSDKQYVTRGGPDESTSIFEEGLFGDLEIQIDSSPISNDFDDKGSTILFRQLVGYISGSEADFDSAFIQYQNDTNSQNIEYILLLQNSNSYAFQVVEKLTQQPRPKSVPYAPGWSRVLVAP